MRCQSLAINGATAATQSWVTSQNYISTSTLGTITDSTLGVTSTYNFNVAAVGYVGLNFPAAEISFSTGGTLNYIDFLFNIEL